MRHALSVLWLSLRASLLVSMQYRLDFFAQGFMQLFWMALSDAPLYIAFSARAQAQGVPLGAAQIGGWDLASSIVVYGFFALLKALLDGVISPALSAAVEHIRAGTLDFLLLKPADAQLLVSTTRFEPFHLLEAVGAAVVIAYGVTHRAGAPLPGASAWLLSLLLLLCAALLLYSIWLLVICAAFYVVKIDNLSYLFTSIFDFGRWPRSVFRGVFHVLFTYVIPLTLMTSYPADALLSQIAPAQVLLCLAWTAAMLLLSRRLWLRSIGRYASASS